MMRPYERIPLDDEPQSTVLFQARPSLEEDPEPTASSSSSVPAQVAPAPFSTRPVPTRGNDGVFANLSAKPEAPSASGKSFQEIEPPSYADVVHDSTPPYFEATIISTLGEDGD
ncbi:hypothetical protein HK104_008451, partial [Borealophlyctis nickersoniae]